MSDEHRPFKELQPQDLVPRVREVYRDIDQHLFLVVENTLRLRLSEVEDRLKYRHTSFFGPLAFLASIILTFTTTQFRDWAGVEAKAWSGAFAVVGIGAIVWLMHAVVMSVFSVSIEQVIDSLMPEDLRPIRRRWWQWLPLIPHGRAKWMAQVAARNEAESQRRRSYNAVVASNADAGVADGAQLADETVNSNPTTVG